MTADPIRVAKTFLAPRFVLEKLTFPFVGYIEVSDEGDEASFKTWFDRRFELKGDVYPELAAETREAVYKDCRSPAFRQKLWAAAREYERRVFGTEVK